MINENVTCVIPTKGRLYTSLTQTLLSVFMQTVRPKYLIIYIDGDFVDIRNVPQYQRLLKAMLDDGMLWTVMEGSNINQAVNHDRSIDDAPTEFIWRVDDDTVAMPNTLELLLSAFDNDVAAVGGLVIDPMYAYRKPISSKIKDIFFATNEQWVTGNRGNIDVDHLYSTFIYRKSIAKEHRKYNKMLSSVAHREETLFSYSMKAAGHRLIVNTNAIMYHFRQPTGGIRDGLSNMWAQDEIVFKDAMTSFGVLFDEPIWVVLDNGIGDHWMFKQILPELRNKKRKIILAVCYPEVFEDEGLDLISIDDAIMSIGQDKVNSLNVYLYCIKNNWKGTLIDAYRNIYL
jgi:hypothetical protein